MLGPTFSPIWAVHISDGALDWPWLAAGFAVLAVLAAVGAWKVRDEEIPLIALLTAWFFVASLIHLPVGITSVHLLFNGLVGVLLGRRAALAIPVGLFLQAALLGHGGLTALGVNSCVMTLPALLAGQLFAGLQRVSWVRRPWFRTGLVAVSALVWVLTVVYSVTLLVSNFSHLESPDAARANELTFHPLTLAAALLVAGAAAWAERRLENAPEFPLGLLVGELAVLATLFLHAFVLYFGGLVKEGWSLLAMVTFVAHLPIAVLEGTVLGFLVGFLARVKPEMLGLKAAEETQCVADSVP